MDKTMKAVVIDSFGPAENMQIREIPVPIPGKGELLVKVFAAGINPVDTYIRKGTRQKMSGTTFPKVIGRDLAGEVESIGPGVRVFKPGDRIMSSVMPKNGGSYAEYAVVEEGRACIIPATVSYEEASGIPIAGVTAIQSFEVADVPMDNKTILIIGASGGVGTFAVQAARELKAKITAVCSSKNSAFVRGLGALEVLEYDRVDYLHSNRKFDFIFDYAGGGDLKLLRGLLNPKGEYITTVRRPELLWNGMFESKYNWFLADINTLDLEWFRDTVGAGKVRVIVDRVFPMEQVVEAHKYVETKRAVGKVILKIR
jgi:NADPH:quinone reductase-like Zn-dependent oxidoreductase